MKSRYLLLINHKITSPYEQSVNTTTFSSQRLAFFVLERIESPDNFHFKANGQLI